MKKVILFMVVLFLFCSVSANAAPLFDQLYYSSRTTLVPGTYTLRFSIWSDIKKGEMVWSEEQAVVISSNIIEVNLGDVTPLPDIDYSLPWYVQVDSVIGTSFKKISKTREILEASPEAHWRYYGVDNFFAGIRAGNLTMTGTSNTAIGNSALNSNTSGDFNTASGYASLYFNTTGNGYCQLFCVNLI